MVSNPTAQSRVTHNNSMQPQDRSKLLKAAARFDSDSSGSGSDSDSDSPRIRKHSSRDKKHSGKKRKKSSKHSKKDGKRQKKRSDHEKIAELERRAAAMGAGAAAAAAGSMLPARLGFGQHGYSSSATASGDAVTLDTSGDANNALYESLYSGDVPRYSRMDPLDLVRVSRRLGGQQLLAGDTSLGNAAADRYYRGRHFLQERSRTAKRINLAALQHRNSSSSSAKPCASASMLLLPPTTPLLPPTKPGSAAGGQGSAAQLQEQHAGSTRRLAIPDPAFIPLEAPQELLQQSQQQQQQQEGDAGSWRQQHGYAGAGPGRQKGMAVTELVEQAGMSPDELLLQATRAWNIAVRERPQDEELWLEFAAFQHSAAQQQQQRGRAASTGLLDPVTAEKQISLLSKGLAHHPSSNQLLLALLRCYAAVAPDAEALEAKWAGVLSRQAGSWELWREYIALRQASFADFKVSAVQKVYQDALHSLQVELLAHRRRVAAALKQQHKQQHKQPPPELTPQQLQQLTPLAVAAASSAPASSGLGLAVTLGEQALEQQLVQLLLGLLYVELEAGYCEHALAKIQALLEFHLFPPPLPPGGVSALLRLFAAYWSAGVPRAGEAGARGWAYWCCWHAMGMEQPAAAPAAQEEAAAEPEQQQEPAGWSGWFQVPHSAQQQASGAAAAADAAVPSPTGQPPQRAAAAGSTAGAPAKQEGRQERSGSERSAEQQESDAEAGARSDSQPEQEEEQEEEQEQEEEELDEEELMRQLGLQLEQQLQEVERQGLPADVLARWVEEEASCSAAQWQPLRTDGTAPGSTAAAGQPTDSQAGDDSSHPDPARIAGLDCVEPCLFLLRSAAALRRLVLGCVELLGVPMGLQGVPWCSSNSPTPWQQQTLSTAQTAGFGGSRGGGWSDAAADGAAADASLPQPQQQLWQPCRQAPWYAASDDRWQWAVNLLQRLVAGGPCSDWHELCQALMVLQASKPSDAAAGQAGSAPEGLQQLTLDGAAAADTAGSGGGPWPSQQQLPAARTAAKQLLSDQQDNLLLYDSYGCLEAAAGQLKTARKIFETALTLATAAAAAASDSGGQQDAASGPAAAAPLLALHLAQLELTAGGKADLGKAHAALHALLAGQQLQVAAGAEASTAAAAAAGTSKQQPQQQAAALGLLADAQLRDARVKFQQRVPELIASAGGFLTPAAAGTIAAAALFELVVGLRSGHAAAGLDAAVAVCKQVTAAVPEAVRASSAQHEALSVLQCHLLVAAAAGRSRALAPRLAFHNSSSGKGGTSSSAADPVLAAALAAAVPPARAREALAAALRLYPRSQPLLQLQVTLDHACYTLSGLRQQLAALLEAQPSPGLWTVALQAEAMRPGGRVRLGVLFERALATPTVLQWHQQERLQRQRKKQAWAAALAAAGMRQQAGAASAAAEQQQALLMQPVTAQGSAAALLDVAVWDGYRGWGHCAGLWQQYIRYELGLGRLDAARKLFLRAVHAVPGAKGLWLSGFGGVCAGLQPRECSGLLNVMQEREVVVRTDVYEVLLAAMAEKQQ